MLSSLSAAATIAPVRTLVVDNERLGRERVRSLLQRSSGVEVVGECENGVEAIQAKVPELIFLDVEMPELNGLAMKPFSDLPFSDSLLGY